MNIVIQGLLAATFIFGCYYYVTKNIVKTEVREALGRNLPNQIKFIHDNIQGEKNITVNIKEDGIAKVTDIEEVKNG